MAGSESYETTEELSSANNQGTAADAEVTGIDGDLVVNAMDRAFAAQGRVDDGETVAVRA